MGLITKLLFRRSLCLEPAGASSIGQRSEQQDAFLIRPNLVNGELLVVVADGMGGQVSGALASRIATDGFTATFANAVRHHKTTSSLSIALDDANRRIRYAQCSAPDAGGMGTTLVGACFSPGTMSWISVGDSPLWLYRAGTLRRLNEDHSLRSLAGDHDRLNPNLLTSAVNGEKPPFIDGPNNLQALELGDLFIVATDGILTIEKQLVGILEKEAASTSKMIANKIIAAVERANKATQDNATIVAVRVGETIEMRTGMLMAVSGTFIVGLLLSIYHLSM